MVYNNLHSPLFISAFTIDIVLLLWCSEVSPDLTGAGLQSGLEEGVRPENHRFKYLQFLLSAGVPGIESLWIMWSCM